MLEELFSAICHRDPARSFPLPGGAVNLCGRCTGLYAGMLGGLGGMLLWRILRRCPRGRGTLVLLALCVAATPVEAVGEAVRLWSGTNLLRFVLGCLTGAALACAIFHPDTTAKASLSRPSEHGLLAIPLMLAVLFGALALRGPAAVVRPVLAAGWAGLVVSAGAGILRQFRRGPAGLQGRI